MIEPVNCEPSRCRSVGLIVVLVAVASTFRHPVRGLNTPQKNKQTKKLKDPNHKDCDFMIDFF